MKDCSKISAGNWIALLGVLVAVMVLVNTIVDRKVDEINVKFDRVEKKIDNIDANFNSHLQYHIETKDCKLKEKEVSYAEVSEASKTTREEDTQSTR